MGTRFLGEIARKHQSYHGTQIALDAYLEHMLNLQPTAFHLRMFIPLFMIQLGDDDRAYNFIKFWVKITPFQVKRIIDHFMFSFILTLEACKGSFCSRMYDAFVKSPKIVPNHYHEHFLFSWIVFWHHFFCRFDELFSISEKIPFAYQRQYQPKEYVYQPHKKFFAIKWISNQTSVPGFRFSIAVFGLIFLHNLLKFRLR